MDKPTVAIVVDSTASLPAPLLARYPIHVVPMALAFEGRSYRDGVDLTPEDFFTLLAQTKRLPQTASPSPDDFLSAFQTAASHAQDILCLTLASELSGTNEAARGAQELARERLPRVTIRLMDTRTAGGAEALIALGAARAALAGKDLPQVTAVAEQIVQRVHFLGVLDTLYYLWKGGRAPWAALWISSLLNIKPILDIQGGRVRLLEKPRTRRRAVERLLAQVKQRAGSAPLRVNIMHANLPQEARQLQEQVESSFRCVEMFTSIFTPVIGAHTGPGLLGIAFHPEVEP